MSNHETELTTRDRVRVYLTGTCDGLPDLQEALEGHPEIEFVGASEQVMEGAATLAGGHLQVVLHASRSTTLGDSSQSRMSVPPSSSTTSP